MITDAMIRQAIEDIFWATQINFAGRIWRSFLISSVGQHFPQATPQWLTQVNHVIDQGIVDGWLLVVKQGIDCQLEIVTEPTTQRSPGPIIKATVPEIKVNLNDYTCQCGRKCNSTDQQCWWCCCPVVKKGLFGP